MDRTKALIIFLCGGAVLFGTAVLAFLFAYALFAGQDVAFGDAIAVVDIDGEIVYDLEKVQEIENHRDDDDIRAVVVHINSPGGGVAASQAIYRALMSTRREKPVVAFMGSVAASGGYYVACAADSILALEGTVTGSIGVVANFLSTEELFHKIGLEMNVIKSGRYKDIGSPHREMTGDERVYLGNLMDTLYFQFVSAVSEGRGMSVDQIRELAEGQLYSGEEAAAIGLIDRTGTFEDAIAVAAQLADIEGKPQIIRRRKRSGLGERVFGEALSKMALSSGERINLKYIIP